MRQVLEAKTEPASPEPEGVKLGEFEAMVLRVLAEELQPMQHVLARLETAASPAGSGSSVSLARERMQRRRAR